MARIKTVTGREVLDSRGYPTVAAEVVLDDGSAATAMVPKSLKFLTRHLIFRAGGGEALQKN